MIYSMKIAIVFLTSTKTIASRAKKCFFNFCYQTNNVTFQICLEIFCLQPFPRTQKKNQTICLSNWCIGNSTYLIPPPGQFLPVNSHLEKSHPLKFHSVNFNLVISTLVKSDLVSFCLVKSSPVNIP